MERSLLFVVTGAALLCAPMACSGADDTSGDGQASEPRTNPSDEVSSTSDSLRFGIPRIFRFRHLFPIRGHGGTGGVSGSAGMSGTGGAAATGGATATGGVTTAGGVTATGGASTQPPGTGGATPGTGGMSTQPPSTGGASTQPPPISGDPIAAARTPDGRAIPQSSLPGGACPQVVVLLSFWSCVTVGDQCSFTKNGVTHHCACIGGVGEGQDAVWSCN